jgi:hypothetical protein
MPPKSVLRRKSPNFVRFILTGAILGFIVGGVIAGTNILGAAEGGNPAYNYSPSAGIGVVSLLFAGLFAIVAAVVAVLLDRRADR